MENPVNTVKNAVPTFRWFLMFLVAFVILNAIVDVLGNTPAAPVVGFIMRPVSFIKSKFGPKTS